MKDYKRKRRHPKSRYPSFTTAIIGAAYAAAALNSIKPFIYRELISPFSFPGEIVVGFKIE